MCNWGYKIDVSHADTAYFRSGNFNTTLLTDNTLVAHLFVLTTKTLIISYRSKDLRTKKPVTLRFERTVVDGFWFFDLTMAPREDSLRACKFELNLLDIFWSVLFTDLNRY